MSAAGRRPAGPPPLWDGRAAERLAEVVLAAPVADAVTTV